MKELNFKKKFPALPILQRMYVQASDKLDKAIKQSRKNTPKKLWKLSQEVDDESSLFDESESTSTAATGKDKKEKGAEGGKGKKGKKGEKGGKGSKAVSNKSPPVKQSSLQQTMQWHEKLQTFFKAIGTTLH